MRRNNPKIGLAFSGGGFRASAFNLGVLSYLNAVVFEDKSLLNNVIALSTISGGTITGARYAIGIKNGESFEEIYKALYSFMTQVDLVDLSLNRLVSKENWTGGRVKSLINAFSDVYDEKLFNRATFEQIMNDERPIHLKHISFNATEFSNALQFRFQWSEKLYVPDLKRNERGIIGNFNFRIPEEVAKEIRMSDILAASSCFPGGFEPINFPDDFILSDEIRNSFELSCESIGLMDGGIVDNQGIEPLLLAEERMWENQNNQDIKTKPKDSENILDLLIISDVSSPFMEDFKVSKQNKMNLWRSLSLRKIRLINLITYIVGISLLIVAALNSNLCFSIILTIILTFLTSFNFVLWFIKSLPGKFPIPDEFIKSLKKFSRIRFIVFENLIMNRSNSVIKLATDVFMKHIRRLNYRAIYKDDSWKNRRIMNAIYELRHNKDNNIDEKIRKGKIPQYLIPSKKIRDVAEVASSMGTTLWFTEKELKCNMPNSIIACGQFTMCWNLLEYIEKLEKDSSNTNANHQVLMDCKQQLSGHWEKFKKDPFWMIL